MMSERDGFAHIYLYDMHGKLVSQVTKGNFDVTALNGCDAKNQLFYYTSAEPTPYQREVYCIKWDGSGKKKLSENIGTNSAKISEGFKYYTISNSSVKSPSTTILFNKKGKTVRVLDDNKALIEKLKDYKFGFREFFSLKTSENVNLYGWMLKPADLI